MSYKCDFQENSTLNNKDLGLKWYCSSQQTMIWRLLAQEKNDCHVSVKLTSLKRHHYKNNNRKQQQQQQQQQQQMEAAKIGFARRQVNVVLAGWLQCRRRWLAWIPFN